MKKLKFQELIDNGIKTTKIIVRGSGKLYAIVKYNGHFECGLHTRKTLSGICNAVRKKQGHIEDQDFVIYELPFKEEFIVYDSKLSKKEINNVK